MYEYIFQPGVLILKTGCAFLGTGVQKDINKGISDSLLLQVHRASFSFFNCRTQKSSSG